MPVATFSNVYRIILQGVCLGQQTLNIFYYGANSPVVDVPNLLDAFDGNVVSNVAGAVNHNWSSQLLTLQAERGGSEFGSLVSNQTGTNGGDCLPPYVTWDFTFLRGGALERNGYKRFAGVGEGNQTNGVADTGIRVALDALADEMFSNLTVDAVEFFPVIRRTRVHRAPQIPPSYWDISGIVYSKIGTQNSRKFGHGR